MAVTTRLLSFVRSSLSGLACKPRSPAERPCSPTGCIGQLPTCIRLGLLSRPKRGVVRITGRGRKVAAAHPDRVDVRVLSEFPEFIDFKSRSHGPRQADQPELAESETTPREAVSTAVDEANAAVAAEVLDRVRQREPAFLERLVLAVLTAMGYGGAAGAAEHLGKSGDEGLDGVIRQDPLGLDRIYVQAQRYGASRAVGRPEIQEFVGALHGAQADRGIFITTSRLLISADSTTGSMPRCYEANAIKSSVGDTLE
jgi:restriction system protein